MLWKDEIGNINRLSNVSYIHSLNTDMCLAQVHSKPILGIVSKNIARVVEAFQICFGKFLLLLVFFFFFLITERVVQLIATHSYEIDVCILLDSFSFSIAL